MITVRVPLGDRSYDVLVGHGARSELAALLPSGVRRAAVVTQAGVPLQVDPGVPFQSFEIGDGEQHKSMATIEQLCRGFAAMGLTRNDVVIGVGGGMVTDVAGLVGMVDAAIGGKTGVNIPEGKNLVGAYWQPSGVICDLDALATLPPREVRCGRGEIAKYHFLTGDDLLAMGEAERVARCVQIKADVVASDEREGGRRALLNYGHTLAHALEIETNHSLAHGEAVGIGLIYAAHLAHHLGRISAERVQQHYDVVGGAYELDTALPDGLSAEQLVQLMGRDKKVLGDQLTFVLDGANGVEVVPDVAATDALAALHLMR